MPQLLAELQRWAVEADPEVYWGAIAILVAAGLLALWFGFSRLRAARLIEDTPTQRVRSAAQGYVELEGRAAWIPGPEIHSPLTRTPCVWWRYRVQQQRGHGRNRRWHTIDRGQSDDLFWLDDGTGTCVIDPVGARVHADLRRSWRGSTRRPLSTPRSGSGLSAFFGFGSYRYDEQLVTFGAPLHVLGMFDTTRNMHQENEESVLRDVISEWKADYAALLERFDRDGDGRLNMQEWQQVRAAARDEARRRVASEPPPPALTTHVLRRPRDGRLFLISTLPQATLAGRKRLHALVLLPLAVACGGLLAALLQARLPL